MDTEKYRALKTKTIAHRGLSAIECENTNAAFIAAGNRSYFGIETDVHVTADKRFVIIHDDTMKRVSGGKKHARRASGAKAQNGRRVQPRGLYRSDIGGIYRDMQAV